MSDPAVSHVDEWITFGQAACELGVSASKVRQLVREHQLAAVRRADLRELAMPREFVTSGAILRGLSGTLTLLSDNGFDDTESIGWLYTPDDSIDGRPIDALRDNRGTEVRRRAQAIG